MQINTNTLEIRNRESKDFCITKNGAGIGSAYSTLNIFIFTESLLTFAKGTWQSK